MISVLNAGNWAEQYSTVGERAFLSITMTLVGIIIVVFILVLLSFVVSLMSRLVNGKKEKPAQAAVAAENPEPVEASQQVIANEVSAEPEDGEALVAAITAAVSCILSDSDQPSAGFKIRRIRRV